jgi:hypothetical protein
MPGTTRSEMLDMPLEDALAVLLGLDVGDDELKQAAMRVVECHAAEVAAKYAPKPEPRLKVVRE